MENLDVLDERGNKTGQVEDINKVHQTGLWHEATHVIVIKNNQLLIQKRSSRMVMCPNIWDLSTGGHVSAGEDALTGAKREFEEELGLNPNDYDFKFQKRYIEKLRDRNLISNEYVDLYVVELNSTDVIKNISKKEIDEIKWISIAELNKMVAEETIIKHDTDYQVLNELLK